MMFTERGEKYCKACARECERCHITSSARGHDETTCTRPSLVYEDIPGDIVARRSNYFVPINKIVRQYIKEQAKDEKRKRIKEDKKKKIPRLRIILNKRGDHEAPRLRTLHKKQLSQKHTRAHVSVARFAIRVTLGNSTLLGIW